MKPRIAVLGCGHWGKNLVRNFNALGQLEMVCDPRRRGAAQRANRAGGLVSDKFTDAMNSSRIDEVPLRRRPWTLTRSPRPR